MDLDDIMKTKAFPEPRLIILKTNSAMQGFIVTEESVVFEVDDFTVIEGITSLIATYYVLHIGYPKGLRAMSFLLFVQEMLIGIPDPVKKSSKYTRLIDLLKE